MKTILITGTTSGIGRVTALELAREGNRIVMANRNREKSEQLAAEIKRETGNENIQLLDLDLASQSSTRACAAAFLEQYDGLDMLINNAGLTSPEEVITEDGFELQFAVNALNQLLFTLALLPALQQATPAQIIFVTSMMHKFGKINPDSFRGWEKYGGNASYNQSKLIIMLLARELAERLRDKDITVSTLHPGAVDTGILDGFSPLAQFFLRRLFIAPEKGARCTLYLARSEPGSLATGQYFVSSKPARSHPLVEDQERRTQLWNECCDLLEADAPDRLAAAG